MYLKKVYAENFKSFGGKVSVPLVKGYTAITGPNGSGKSNITDAILFVLGSKSSKVMRAGKLIDLINKDNKGKKADYAKVTLYFDNTDRLISWDADEVKLTRIIKPLSNGDVCNSTFYINDQKSTMAEFDSLLTRAKISADGYNVVQQGDITDIIKMSGTERRHIIDDISGISSYDSDILKADNERDEAQRSICDLEVITGELKKRIDELEVDMEEAKKYIETKNSLDIANSQLIRRRLSNKEEEYRCVYENVKNLQKQVDDLIQTRDRCNVDIKRLDAEIKEKDAEILAKTGPEYIDLKGKIDDVKLKKALICDTVIRETRQIEQYKNSINEQTNKIQNLEASLAGCIDSSADLKIKIDEKENAIADAKTVLEGMRKEMDANGGENRVLETNLATIEKNIDLRNIDELKLNKEKTEAEILEDDTSRVIAELETTIDNIDFEIKDKKWNLQKIKRETYSILDFGALANKIRDLRIQELDLEKQERTILDKIHRISQECNSMTVEKNVTEKLLQGSGAVATVLRMRDQGLLNGIHGTIAELATVRPEFETALSVAAGGKMQAIIVDDDKVAATAIEKLKLTGHGRATFLPLNKMVEGKPRARAITSVKQSLGYALDFVSFKQEYRAAFWYVYTDTIVVENITEGRQLMGNVRIVTKNGELFESSGAITGGTIKTPMIKFNSTSEFRLNEAKTLLKTLNSSLGSIRSQLKSIRDDIHSTDNDMRRAGMNSIDLQGKIGKIEASIKSLEETKICCKEKLDAKREKYIKVRDEKAEIEKNLIKVTEDLNDLRNQKISVKNRILEIGSEKNRQKIQDIMGTICNLTDEKNVLVNALNSLGLKISEYSNTKYFLSKNISELQTYIESAKRTVINSTTEDSRLKIELDALGSIEKDIEKRIERLRDEKNTLGNVRSEMIKNRDTAINNIEIKSGIKSNLEASLSVISEQISDLRDKETIIKTDATESLPSEEVIKRNIKFYESTMRELGNVNLRAIDDYSAVKERHDVLTGNINRLNKQISDLTSLVDSLESKKKRLFLETYSEIDKNFRSIYMGLSGGGEAFMSLDDESNPFEGGLIINARPKNGKMLSLNLLSGGEKSLTALAFILAVQEYNPSPFYIFDEVDMFLDSVNSETVAKYLRKNSMKTQFIQVSLRKVTLALADYLIGVTRPPSGISKIIIQPNLTGTSKQEKCSV
ncbi:MAG: chromosome segregation protein SMC [archaeon]|nr:chromosome segregation protein SMC [archaeon]